MFHVILKMVLEEDNIDIDITFDRTWSFIAVFKRYCICTLFWASLIQPPPSYPTV
jgi:hypothetical protein